MLLGSSAAAWPPAARAQQTTPLVIGFLSSRATGDAPQLLSALRQGLKESGFVEGQNVTIEYRFAGNQNERLPKLAADLVQRQVTVIFAAAVPAAVAAKAATTNIPIIFEMGADPVRQGLVSSLNRPGSNLTGVTSLNTEVAPKRLQLLHELLPTARTVALLVNPTNPAAKDQLATTLSVANGVGLDVHAFNVSSERDFDSTFASLMQMHAGGLVISSDVFFTARQEQIAALVLRNKIPAVYESREFVAAGGLMGYGGNLTDAYRLGGIYAGRVLKGEKPADLPVQQSTKVELFLNLKTAKALGINVPLPMLGRADEVIE
jgi:putative ABC transport system substrate-binding protein